MEVHKENFSESFDFIKQSIKDCDFITIDTEFTGYSASRHDRGTPYDTTEVRYQKLK